MAMQICVLCDERLGSIAEWQKAIDAEGFPLRLSDEGSRQLANGGNLAVRLRDEETNIEYGVYDFSELRDTYERVNFGRDRKHVVAFTWSSDFAEEIAAWIAATAYARAIDGVVFDEQEGKILTPDESLQTTRDIERRRPAMEAFLQNYIDQLSAKSPEAEATLRAFMQRRFTKPDQS